MNELEPFELSLESVESAFGSANQAANNALLTLRAFCYRAVQREKELNDRQRVIENAGKKLEIQRYGSNVCSTVLVQLLSMCAGTCVFVYARRTVASYYSQYV
jgi:hypothetical protein